MALFSLHQRDELALLLGELLDDLGSGTVDVVELDWREDLDPNVRPDVPRQIELGVLTEEPQRRRRHLECRLDRQNDAALFGLMEKRRTQVDIGVLDVAPLPIEPVIEDRQHGVAFAVHELRHSDVFIQDKHRQPRVARIRVRHTRHVVPADHRGEDIAPGVVGNSVVRVLVAKEAVLEARVDLCQRIDDGELIDIGVVRDGDNHLRVRFKGTCVLSPDDALAPSQEGVESSILDQTVASTWERHDGRPQEEHREKQTETEGKHNDLPDSL
jgi:hypothetical protein